MLLGKVLRCLKACLGSLRGVSRLVWVFLGCFKARLGVIGVFRGLLGSFWGVSKLAGEFLGRLKNSVGYLVIFNVFRVFWENTPLSLPSSCP